MNHGEEMSILGLILGASMLVKIVMLILVLASLISWYLIILRSKQLASIERGMAVFIERLRSSTRIEQFYTEQEHLEAESSMQQIFEAGYQEFELLKNTDSPQLIEGTERAMAVAIGEADARLEEGLSVLATIGSVSPYIGLFGTVWGIMNAFIGLSHVQQATLNTVAPGIAEALIATAIGLFAAIPAVIAYNRLSGKASAISARYYHFANEVQLHLNRSLLARG